MNNEKLKPSKVFLNGIITENPTFRLVLGTCPTLAITTTAFNGMGMGLAATFVLLCSNVMISLLRNIIPDKVRIPAYITIVATFVTALDMLLAKFVPSLYETLGIFIPLIVVNCIILGRAEAFASKHSVGLSALDGLGMGLGFTCSLTLLGFIRELIGAGTFFGGTPIEWEIPWLSQFKMGIFVLPAGGFLTFGLVMAVVNYISNKHTEKKVLAETNALIEANKALEAEVTADVVAPETKVVAKTEPVKTAEPVKVEGPKVETPKTEPIKVEEPKTEPVKTDIVEKTPEPVAEAEAEPIAETEAKEEPKEDK